MLHSGWTSKLPQKELPENVQLPEGGALAEHTKDRCHFYDDAH